MRYILLAVSEKKIYPVATDFKLIAFFIAFFCRLLFREICILDTDSNECFRAYSRGENPLHALLPEPAKSR
mgnify:CR=1 FL=1